MMEILRKDIRILTRDYITLVHCLKEKKNVIAFFAIYKVSTLRVLFIKFHSVLIAVFIFHYYKKTQRFFVNRVK